MILNPSHEITLSGLPPDILDAYVRYKKGTRAIVCWIVQYGPARYQGVKSLPLKELAALVSSVKETLKSLPDVIHFHFRETIAARRRLSKHFRGFVDESLDNVDTVNHEHFTTSLSQIYADLCECCGKPERHCTIAKERNVQNASEKAKNKYDQLPLEDVSLGVSNDESDPLTLCGECSTIPSDSCSVDSNNTGGLIDDDLGNQIEIMALIKQAYDLSSIIQQSWIQVAENKLNFIAAAFSTNVALASLIQLETRMREIDGTVTIPEMHEKYCNLVRVPSIANENLHQFMQQLWQIRREFAQVTDRCHLSNPIACGGIQKPADYLQSASTSHDNAQYRLLQALLINILHLVRMQTPPSDIIRNRTPVYPDLGYTISHPNDNLALTRSVLGLYLLSEGYAAYSSASPQPASITSFRLTALKIAQQTFGAIDVVLDDKTSFPCRCTQTLAYHLQNLSADMKAYTTHRCWDLYFQSPWVAGNHILEMLDQIHFYGAHLLNYRHYIGAVVHSYNVLQQLAGLEKIHLLEAICDEFANTFFPGGNRPTSNFRAGWTRYIGARLKFRKGHKSRNHRESWCMAVPAHAARSAAGLGLASNHNRKGQQSTTTSSPHDCLLFRIKQQDYNVSEAQWTSLSQMHDNETKDSASLLTLAHHISSSLTSSQSTSTIGPYPPKLLLNPFALFSTTVKQIITPISNFTHSNPTSIEKGLNCICFVSNILAGADRIIDARKMGKVEAWRSRPGSEEKTEKEVVVKLMELLKESMATVEQGGKNKDGWGAWGLKVGC